MSEDEKRFIDELVGQVRRQLDMSDAQARNLIASIIADTPEGLPEAICSMVEHIRLLQIQMAMVDLATQCRGAVQLKLQDGQLSARIDPKCEVASMPGGIEVRRPTDA